MLRKINSTLAVAWLILMVAAGCAGPPKGISFPNESFSAEQLYKRRAELNGKTVRAHILWQYNFEVCDTTYVAPNGYCYNMGMTLRDDQLSQTSSVQWHTIKLLIRDYWRAQWSARDRGDVRGVSDLWYWLDADIAVRTRANENVIRGPMMDLDVIAIRTIRQGERLGR